jgi:hypothetical protein
MTNKNLNGVKVKELHYDFLNEYCTYININGAWFSVIIEKRSSRSFYIWAKKQGCEFPCAYYRVSANEFANDVIKASCK